MADEWGKLPSEYHRNAAFSTAGTETKKIFPKTGKNRLDFRLTSVQSEPGRDEEEAELTRMMDEWGGLVLGLCAVTLQDGHLAQDAAQETFVKAWSHRANWPNLQNRRAWLARIAVNTCRDMQRGGWFRHVTRKQTLDDLSGLAAPETSQREVMEAVNALPREQRQIVLLRFWQNLSGEEIAECLGLSRSAVYRKMDKAKKNLRLTLEGEDVP